jgi:hypothetical protein
VNTVLWLVAASSLGACELAGRTMGRGWPTAAELFGRVRRPVAGRILLVAAWLWLGWHVFAR